MNTPQAQKHKQKQHGTVTCSPRTLKMAVGMMGMCLSVYIVGPPLYWHLSEALYTFTIPSSSSFRRHSCPPCICDCSSHSLFSLPEGVNSSFFTDCLKHDPDVSEATEKSYTESLSEELKMREAQTLENQQRADKALLEAKKMASQYQKEADKCNSGMETCEAAREKAEATLETQKEVTAMWELRARQKGWREGIIRPQDGAMNETNETQNETNGAMNDGAMTEANEAMNKANGAMTDINEATNEANGATTDKNEAMNEAMNEDTNEANGALTERNEAMNEANEEKNEAIGAVTERNEAVNEANEEMNEANGAVTENERNEAMNEANEEMNEATTVTDNF